MGFKRNVATGIVGITLAFNSFINLALSNSYKGQVENYEKESIRISKEIEKLEAIPRVSENKEFQRYLQQKRNKVYNSHWMQEINEKKSEKAFRRAFVYGWFK